MLLIYVYKKQKSVRKYRKKSEIKLEGLSESLTHFNYLW